MEAGRLVVFVLWAILAGCGSAAYRSPPESVPSDRLEGSGSLAVRVVGFDTRTGEVALALYDSAESFGARRDPVATARLPIESDAVIWRVVSGLVPGQYAVAAYHDADADGELDRAVAGWPTESYGFSNNARRIAGPPSFKAAAFSLEAGENQIEIRVR